jgi:hypothetical protein
MLTQTTRTMRPNEGAIGAALPSNDRQSYRTVAAVKGRSKEAPDAACKAAGNGISSLKVHVYTTSTHSILERVSNQNPVIEVVVLCSGPSCQ